MDDEGFKRWLEANGAKTASGRNTRVHAVRTIERNLKHLNSPHDDLAAAYTFDRFEQLRERLRRLREDARNGGTDFRILMPASEEPMNRLSSWKSWLAQYGQFLSGQHSQAPSIVLHGHDGFDYEPRYQHTAGKIGYVVKPKGASNEAEEAHVTPDPVEMIRALLKDGLAVRIGKEGETWQNFLTYPGKKFASYTLRADIAEALHIPVEGNLIQATLSGEHIQMPTNLILYGPPGTGKTHATAAEAVRLCDGSVPPDGGALRERYRELVAAGQVRFVTMHQSYAYEDFVEGLRPTTGGSGEGQAAGFSLQPVPGIFREIAAVAERATRVAEGGDPFELGERQVFKMSLGRAGSEDHIFDAAIEGGYVVLGWGGDIDWTRFDSYEAIHARWNQDHPGTSGNDGNISQLWRFRCSMQPGDLVVISYGNTRLRAIGEITGGYEYAPTGEGDYNHRRAVRWLYTPDEPQPVTFYSKPFTMRSCYLLRDEFLNRAALALLLPGSGGPAAAPKQFVLICDEINRANISKVFGELITLLEPDKRLGAPNEIRVRLPYSGDLFGVPANLHIVGTMNTADRSVALLDTALRRRFEFRELMPEPEALAEASAATGIDLVTFLRTINDRIEYLFDREHQIGHAFFIACRTRTEVDAAMRAKVIPLLTEYFFEDWGRVADVLGGREGNKFLEKVALKPPPGLAAEEGGERWRWLVRKSFLDDAYAIQP